MGVNLDFLAFIAQTIELPSGLFGRHREFKSAIALTVADYGGIQGAYHYLSQRTAILDVDNLPSQGLGKNQGEGHADQHSQYKSSEDIRGNFLVHNSDAVKG